MREISLRSAMIEAAHARPWKEECGCQQLFPNFEAARRAE